MATNMRRFTVSITPSMDMELDEAKKENYYKNTQSDMIRDLIMRGLQDLKTEKEAKKNRCDRVS